MWFGRYELGQELALRLLATGLPALPGTSKNNQVGNVVAVVPDLRPGVMVYGPSGQKVLSATMAPLDKFGQKGLYQYRTLLDGRFSVGPGWMVVFCWRQTTWGVETPQVGVPAPVWGRSARGCFEIVPGGDPAGAVIAQYYSQRPQATFLVQVTDGGTRVFGQNPQL